MSSFFLLKSTSAQTDYQKLNFNIDEENGRIAEFANQSGASIELGVGEAQESLDKGLEKGLTCATQVKKESPERLIVQNGRDCYLSH